MNKSGSSRQRAKNRRRRLRAEQDFLVSKAQLLPGENNIDQILKTLGVKPTTRSRKRLRAAYTRAGIPQPDTTLVFSAVFNMDLEARVAAWIDQKEGILYRTFSKDFYVEAADDASP